LPPKLWVISDCNYDAVSSSQLVAANYSGASLTEIGEAMPAKIDVVEPLAVKPRIASQLLSCSHVTIYARIKDGTLPSFKMGKTRLIPLSAIKEVIERGVAAAHRP
jgi:excisionase family DNA binding protein